MTSTSKSSSFRRGFDVLTTFLFRRRIDGVKTSLICRIDVEILIVSTRIRRIYDVFVSSSNRRSQDVVNKSNRRRFLVVSTSISHRIDFDVESTELRRR